MADKPLEQTLTQEDRYEVKCIIPPKSKNGVGHKVFELLGDYLEYRDELKLPQKWLRNYELYRNKHWKRKGPVPLSSANLIWTTVERTVNILTDNAPTFDIQATDDERADILHKNARYWWNDTEQQDVLADSVLMGEISGCVCEKVIFNPNLRGGLGDVEVITIDPFNFGFWPIKEKRPSKWEAVFHFYRIPVNQARRKWPAMAKYITSDKEWADKLGEERVEVFGGTVSEFTGSNVITGDQARDRASMAGNRAGFKRLYKDDNNVLIVECWVKDYTTEKVITVEEVETTDPVTGEKMVVESKKVVDELKYPGGIRVITCCNGGDVVLSDRENPSINPAIPKEMAAETYLYDKFPFSWTNSNKDPVSPFGFSSIEQLEMLNFEIDKCLSQLNYIKDKAVRSPVINPRTSQVPNSSFTNRPAKVINPKDHIVAGAIKHMDPPPLHRDIEMILGIYRELFNAISGQFDLTNPDILKGRMAFKTVSALLENIHTMLRGKIRAYNKMIRERGRMYLSHVFNWFTEERQYYVREKGVPTIGNFTGSDLAGPIHFEVVSGSTMPVSRMQLREEALELFQAGAIDLRELLDKIDWPNKAEVTKRMEQGVLGGLIERMQALNVDPQIIEQLQKIMNMDESEYNAVVNQMKKAQAEDTKAMEEANAQA